jgi:hypothetical protein
MSILFKEMALTPEERRGIFNAKKPRKTGHAAAPGSGPQGEFCRTCAHLYRNRMAKTYLKCSLMRAHWTGGGGSDVKARDPACKEWVSTRDGKDER